MRWSDQFKMRLSLLFRRKHATSNLDDELRYHLERQIAENLAAGMSPAEARAAAHRAFGNPALLRDQTRATWSWNWLESLINDALYGMRSLARTPGFTFITILVIALGIGVNVALFTIVRSVLLKPLPFADPSRLVRLFEVSSDGKFPFNDSAAGMYAEWRKLNHSFTDMALCGYAGYNLSGDAGQLPEDVRAGTFSSNFLPVLGIQPALGRSFTAAEDQPSANPTVILSWGLWKRRFGGNPNILNQTILLDTRPYTVIGVMPSWFALPNPAAQLWTPIYYKEPATLMKAIDDHDFTAIGRLKPSVSLSQAVNELTLITRHIHDANLSSPFVSIGANAKPLLEFLVGDLKTPLYVLLAATGCLLLIACLNVANLLVARAAARRKELAIRTAMGGSRLRLLRQHLAESLILSLAGGVVGFVFALGALQWFIASRHEMARAEAIAIDWIVVAFSLAIVILFAAFAGLISAFSIRGHQPLATLQESSRSTSAGQTRTRLRAALLTIEVSLTVVLLIGAGLLIKSYARMRSTDLGCLTQNVLKLDIHLPRARYGNIAQVANFLDPLLVRAQNIPGVRAAAYVFPMVPGDGYGGDNGFTIVEHPPLAQGKLQYASHRWSDPGYFTTIGIPILRGHTFTNDQRPGHATQVMISQEFARIYFPGEDPIGKHVVTLGKRPFEIIGVVGDTLFSIGRPAEPMMYFPLYAIDDLPGATLVVRSDRDVTQFATPIQRIVSQMDRDLAVSDILTMEQVIGRNTIDSSLNATLLTAFAALSLILAAVGLFGVLSYVVAQRTSEIGIRMALGAQRSQVLEKVLADGLRPAVVGIALGVPMSAALVGFIKSMLYQTQPVDLAVFAGVVITLLLVAAVACMLPAWRASRIDPMNALRTE